MPSPACSALHSRQEPLFFFHLSSLIPQSLTLLNFSGITCCLSLCHSCSVKVFQLEGIVSGGLNQFITEALFMQRTTGSTEELQKSHNPAAYQMLFFPAGSGNFFVHSRAECCCNCPLTQHPLHCSSGSFDLRLTWEKQACQQEPDRKTMPS